MGIKVSNLSMEDRRKAILDGNVLKVLLLLSIPTIMMAFVQAMIPFTDGLFLNNLIGAEKAGAVTYSQPSINIMLGLSQGLGVAAMAMIGQMTGKGDIKSVKNISLQILVFGLICGLVLIPITLVIGSEMSYTVNANMRDDVYLYISLSSIIVPFQFMASIFNAIKNSTGNPEASFYRMVVLLFLKIVFNTIFLKMLGLGIRGAIFASFCSYLITSIWMYNDLFVRESIYKLEFKNYRFKKEIIFNLVKLSIPSMLSFMMINLGFLLINMELSKYGSIVIGAIGIASNINSLCFQLPSCIGTTVTSMLSINIGVENVKRSKKIFMVGIIVSVVISFVTLALVIPFTPQITRLFTKQQEVLDIANASSKIYIYSILPYGIFMICQSVFNALGRNVIPLIMGILRIWLFRYVFILLTQSYLGYTSVFYGNLFSNTLAMVIFVLIMTKLEWKTGIKYGKN